MKYEKMFDDKTNLLTVRLTAMTQELKDLLKKLGFTSETARAFHEIGGMPLTNEEDIVGWAERYSYMFQKKDINPKPAALMVLVLQRRKERETAANEIKKNKEARRAERQRVAADLEADRAIRRAEREARLTATQAVKNAAQVARANRFLEQNKTDPSTDKAATKREIHIGKVSDALDMEREDAERLVDAGFPMTYRKVMIRMYLDHWQFEVPDALTRKMRAANPGADAPGANWKEESDRILAEAAAKELGLA